VTKSAPALEAVPDRDGKEVPSPQASEAVVPDPLVVTETVAVTNTHVVTVTPDAAEVVEDAPEEEDRPSVASIFPKTPLDEEFVSAVNELEAALGMSVYLLVQGHGNTPFRGCPGSRRT